MPEPKSSPIVQFAVERRVTIAMAVVGVLVLGWLSLNRLPLEFLPSFSSSSFSGPSFTPLLTAMPNDVPF